MDLQKVAIQANNGTAQNGQRTDAGIGETGKSSLPFADMIRIPFVGVGELFSSLSDHPASINKTSDDNHHNDTETHAPTDEAISRKDAPDNAQRDDNARAENPSDDRVEKTSSRDDNAREDHEPRDNRDNQASEDAPADDDGAGQSGEADASDANSAEDADTDDTFVSSDTAPHETTDTTASNDPAFEPALAGLINAAQGSDQNNTVKAAAMNLRDAATGTNAGRAADGPVQQLPGSTPVGEQDVDGETQQALRQVVRQGTGQSGAATDTASRPTDQTLAQQQAKMLADSLRPDKPVKVSVNVENRANIAVSQPSQSLSSSALAAQNGEGSTQTSTGLQSTVRPPQFQAAANNAAGQNGAQTQAQVQVATQATEVAAANAGERSLTRALVQTTAGQHGNTGGTEASSGNSAIAPGTQAQQTAAAQRPQAAQAPRAAQQPQPIVQQISVNISKAIAEGMDRISIQLRPDNLGRVEVKLEVGQNGRVSAQIIADRPEALEALRNDSRDLEKALQDAGLQANAGDLSFSLRDQQENPDDSDSDNRLAGDEEDQVDGDLEAELATRLLNGDLDGFISDTRVDIRA